HLVRRVPFRHGPGHPVAHALGARHADDLGALGDLVGQLAAPPLVHHQPVAQIRQLGHVVPHLLGGHRHVGLDVNNGHRLRIVAAGIQRPGLPRNRFPIRIAGSNSVRGTYLPPVLTTFGTTPGTTLRLPASIPPIAASATSRGETCAIGMLNRSALAISAHSVGTGPGHNDVTDTPVPDSSSWTASEKVCTNALVAEYTAIKGIGWKPAIEAMFRHPPAPRSPHA